MTENKPPNILVFDAYGTLFDVHAAAARHKDEIGDDWQRLTEIWRTKQLEYTWVLAASGAHADFWSLTEQGLDYAASSIGGLKPGVRERLLDAYKTLDAYPEVPEVLARLKARGAVLAILSNGDQEMLADAISAAGLQDAFDAVLSAEDAGIFKPSPRIYELVTSRFGVAPDAVAFQSSNRWDIAGARLFGFETNWINRSNAPDEYPNASPTRTLRDLNALAPSL